MHHTVGIGTVTKSPGMPQLVHYLLENALAEEDRILWQTVERLSQARQRDKGLSPAHRRLPKDEVQAAGVTVDIGQPHHPLSGGAVESAQHSDERTRPVLLAVSVVTSDRQRNHFTYNDIPASNLCQPIHQPRQEFGRDSANGYKSDVCVHHQPEIR